MSEPRSSALMDFQSTYAATLDSPQGRALRRGMGGWPLWAKAMAALVLLVALVPAVAVGSVVALAGGALLLAWEAARQIRLRRQPSLAPSIIDPDSRRR